MFAIRIAETATDTEKALTPCLPWVTSGNLLYPLPDSAVWRFAVVQP